MVSFLQTRHSFRPEKKLLDLHRNVFGKPLEVDKRINRLAYLDIIRLMDFTLRCKQVVVKLDKHFNFFELPFGNISVI